MVDQIFMEFKGLAHIKKCAAFVVFMMILTLNAQTQDEGLITINAKEANKNKIQVKASNIVSTVEYVKLATFPALKNLLVGYFRWQNCEIAWDLAESIIPEGLGKELPWDHTTISIL